MSLDGLVKDDFGAVVQITVTQDAAAVNVAAYTTKNVVLEKPSGEEVTKVATLVNDGADGLIQFTFADGDLDEAGTHRLQVQLSNANAELSSLPVTFHVERRL